MELLNEFKQQARTEKDALLLRIGELNEALQAEIMECGLPYCQAKNDKENLPYQVKLLEDELNFVKTVTHQCLSGCFLIVL